MPFFLENYKCCAINETVQLPFPFGTRHIYMKRWCLIVGFAWSNKLNHGPVQTPTVATLSFIANPILQIKQQLKTCSTSGLPVLVWRPPTKKETNIETFVSRRNCCDVCFSCLGMWGSLPNTERAKDRDELYSGSRGKNVHGCKWTASFDHVVQLESQL